ncbi:hypothetical protein BP5796_09555 [Coleophoma crateriformis]|uniref:Uncharacterized protein n=1 Tax=Coleophoma crateriformis TaxID=565419 RepID=A0A3D8QYD4_9HELO|nr:hypothetical protein BP5796_09555 [Coleophoma crateriformis]
MPANGKPNGRFELPALTPISYSLTEGTDIPPPPDSPIEEPPIPPAPVAPRATTPDTRKPASPAYTKGSNGSTNDVFDGGYGRSNIEIHAPLSPASEKRPSSIRRLFSRKSLNQNYTNGTNGNESNENLHAANIQRPESSLSFLERPGLIKKKSGSWFKRLGGSDTGNRASMIFDSKISEEEKPMSIKKGPPPPKLPELNQFKAKVQADQGSFGGADLFKNIK